MLYFADVRWWEWHRERREFLAFQGEKATIENTGCRVTDESIALFHNNGRDSLSLKPNALATGQNSGYQAVNLAVLLGARRLLLCGFDLQLGPAGEPHWFGEHPIATKVATFSAMLANFNKLAPELKRHGVEVINCSPWSALQCFKRGRLDEEIARLQPDPPAAVLPR